MSREKHNVDDARFNRLACVEEALQSEELDCDNFEERINDVMDQRRLPQEDPLLTRHACECQQCLEILKDYSSVGDSLKLLKKDIAEILARADQARNDTQEANARKRMVWVFGVLAAVFTMVAGSWWLDTQSQESSVVSQQIMKNPTIELLEHRPVADASELQTAVAPISTHPHSEFSSNRSFSMELVRNEIINVAQGIPHFGQVAIGQSIDGLSRNLEAIEPIIPQANRLQLMVPAPVHATIELFKSLSGDQPEAGDSLQKKVPLSSPDLGSRVARGLLVVAV